MAISGQYHCGNRRQMMRLKNLLIERHRFLIRITFTAITLCLALSWWNVFNQMVVSDAEPEIIVTEQDIQAAIANLDHNIEKAKKLLRDHTNQSVEHFWNLKERNYILLITSWRTGSTFLSEPLAKHPASFLHYEPLWHFGVRQIRTGKMAEVALEHLKILLQCNYSNPYYNDVVSNELEQFAGLNGLMWDSCAKTDNRFTCSEPDYLARACQRFPTVVAKIVRLRLNLTRNLLENSQFRRLKIVFLVRDPRATMLSRHETSGWCTHLHPDCSDPQRLCNDMISDLDAYSALSAKFPERLMLVKYETLAAEPLETFEQIFNFCELPFIPSVQKVILKRTSRHIAGESSTSRVSSERIDRWKTEMSKETAADIQRVCLPVLERLDYKLV